MRFKRQIHKIGNRRIRKEFLFFPKWIDNEIRWLETASWMQEEGYNIYNGDWYWEDLYWMEDDKGG